MYIMINELPKQFQLNNKVFTLNEKDNMYYSEDGNYANYIEVLDRSNIITSDQTIIRTYEQSPNILKIQK